MDKYTLLLTLSKHFPGFTFEYLNAVVLDILGESTTNQHDWLVNNALNNDTIISYLVDMKKIQAIKELRVLTGCGLREAKDAVEDERVETYAAGVRKHGGFHLSNDY